jgi:hypothetical protein
MKGIRFALGDSDPCLRRMKVTVWDGEWNMKSPEFNELPESLIRMVINHA